MKWYDFVVVGSGIAGLSFALRAAEFGSVVVITKKDDAESATNMAQGGIAAVVRDDDSFEKHIEDTMKAGMGLSHREAVELAVKNGPDAVRHLVEWGARFTRDESGGSFALGREGGHSERRIVHAADMTGREIEDALLSAVDDHRSITVLEDHMALELALVDGPDGRAVAGVHTLDQRATRVLTVRAPIVMLATGGCGKVYLYTSNPEIATGDGIAMAWRAGVAVRNMEFIQFHPTCLYHPEVRSFLISEAVRGEGAVLTTLAGERFMENEDPRKELAPRDIVARAIDRTMKRTGDKHVYLDITHVDSEHVRQRFPNIHAELMRLGIDMTTDPVPVVPAAHYLCGGVAVDLECRTTIPGLYVSGEAAHTGMHGANRLASNSLLEAVVFSERAAVAATGELEERRHALSTSDVREWEGNDAGRVPEGVLLDYNWDVVRRLMWDYVGIVRTARRLDLARRRMAAIRREIADYRRRYPVSHDLIELSNISLVGELIIRSALRRRESRGLHSMEDFPERDDERYGHDTIVEGGGA
ncbi:MAG: L-aspartate oxidase [Candidatus Eisenbacteria bacterium]|nr:L-aspartate oxidase [Candidatus Eisenbacteria bacterium]